MRSSPSIHPIPQNSAHPPLQIYPNNTAPWFPGNPAWLNGLPELENWVAGFGKWAEIGFFGLFGTKM